MTLYNPRVLSTGTMNPNEIQSLSQGQALESVAEQELEHLFPDNGPMGLPR